MKTNFDINIPSMPSKMIKFKIQDIKSTAFGSQRNRFNQNKAFLTKKFIQSFNNFHQKLPEMLDNSVQTEADSRASRVIKSEAEYRILIPQEKKYMLHNYDKYKNYQAPIAKETKYNRGYSFYKTDPLNSSVRQAKNRQNSASIPSNTILDNFYFADRKSMQKQGRVKSVKPTCVFQNQTRSKVYGKLQKVVAALPGPGTYIDLPFTKPTKPIQKQTQKQSEFDYKNLKKIITNIVVNENQPIYQQSKQQEQDDPKKDYMFIQDDRDRFGNQKYPIAGHINVPGPGAYQTKNSLEEKVHKILVVQEQRKLLKEWFNN